MKKKVIDEYAQLLKQASKGRRLDYEHILEKISFIEIGGKLKDPTKVYQNLMLN